MSCHCTFFTHFLATDEIHTSTRCAPLNMASCMPPMHNYVHATTSKWLPQSEIKSKNMQLNATHASIWRPTGGGARWRQAHKSHRGSHKRETN